MTPKDRAFDNVFTVSLGAAAFLPSVVALVLLSFGGPALDAWFELLVSSSPPLFEIYVERFQSYPGNWEHRLAALYFLLLLSPLPVSAGLVFSVKVIEKYRRAYMSDAPISVFGRVFFGLLVAGIVFYASIGLAGTDRVATGSLMQSSNAAMLLMTTAGLWTGGMLLGLTACDVRLIIQRALGPNYSLKRTNQSLRD